MKPYKIFLYIITLFVYLTDCFATPPDWQNDKLDIQIYTKKISADKIHSLIKITLKDGWSIYWDNPGDAGSPTSFRWNRPTNIIDQSVPQKTIYDNILGQYGYSDTAYYLFETQSNDTSLQVDISWEACKTECIKEKAHININASITSEEKYQENLLKANKTFILSKNIDAEAMIRYKNDTPQLEVFINNSDIKETINSIYFMPYQKNLIYVADKQFFTTTNSQTILSVNLIRPIIPTKGGLLFINDNVYKLHIIPKMDNIDFVSVLYIIVLAFIGGIVLNFMPCVFPVLSIKALSSSFEKPNFKGAFLYFIGVISSFLGLATILYIIRQAGTSAGWGFQLQSPVFVSILLIIFVFLLLMMFDVVIISPKLINWFNKKASINSFMSGFFAVLIASPCTGPFLGAVLGYTLTQSPSLYFLIFLSLGIGYAIPFSIIEIYPETISKIMPKSGKWTVKLKYILSIPMFLTLIWLSWILFNQLKPTASNENSHFIRYNEKQILHLINSGKPVFIEYTAKWCLTCLLNEKTVLNTKEFIQLAQKNNITLFRADWTNQDEDIGKSIKSYSRNSVPLYIYYPPKSQDYTILPQILTFDIIKSAID